MSEQQGVADGGRRVNARLILGVLAAVTIVLFVVQNTERVPVQFLWIEGEFPLFLLLLITMALTVMLVLGATWFMRRRSSST